MMPRLPRALIFSALLLSFQAVSGPGLVRVHAQEQEEAPEAEADQALALPDWEQQEIRISPLGGGLLPQSPGDMQPGAAGAENVPDDIPVAPPVAPAADDLEEVGRDFFHLHGAPTAFSPIIDPGEALPQEELNRLHQTLVNYALTARVSIRLVLLNSQQRLPENANLTHLGLTQESADAAAGLSCLVVYPVGEPWRVRMFTSRAISQVAPPEDMTRLAQACIKEALKTNEPVEQLQTFLNQLCIKLTWLERSYALPAAQELTPETAELVSGTATSHTEQEQVTLLDHVWMKVQPWLWKGIAVLVGLIVMFMLVRTVHKRLRRRAKVSVWILPDPRIEQRLGGKYCGSGGVSVRY